MQNQEIISMLNETALRNVVSGDEVKDKLAQLWSLDALSQKNVQKSVDGLLRSVKVVFDKSTGILPLPMLEYDSMWKYFSMALILFLTKDKYYREFQNQIYMFPSIAHGYENKAIYVLLTESDGIYLRGDEWGLFGLKKGQIKDFLEMGVQIDFERKSLSALINSLGLKEDRFYAIYDKFLVNVYMGFKKANGNLTLGFLESQTRKWYMNLFGLEGSSYNSDNLSQFCLKEIEDREELFKAGMLKEGSKLHNGSIKNYDTGEVYYLDIYEDGKLVVGQKPVFELSYRDGVGRVVENKKDSEVSKYSFKCYGKGSDFSSLQEMSVYGGISNMFTQLYALRLSAVQKGIVGTDFPEFRGVVYKDVLYFTINYGSYAGLFETSFREFTKINRLRMGKRVEILGFDKGYLGLAVRSSDYVKDVELLRLGG